MFVNTLIVDVIEDDSSFATVSSAFFRNSPFRLKVCSSISTLSSVWLEKNCAPSATCEVDVFTSMVVFRTSSRNMRRIFSVTLSSNLERKSAAVLTELVLCEVFKICSSTYSHAFHKDSGAALVRKKGEINLFYFETIFGFDASHKMCANSRIAI